MSEDAETAFTELAISLAHMARELIAEDSVPSTLDAIASHGVDTVDGCEAASIVVLTRDRKLSTLAATNEIGPESNRIQTDLGEGPCFEMADNALETLRVADMSASGSRWPHYVPQARVLGIGSMMGFLLFTARGNLGMLNFYSSKADAFTQHSETVGWIFASHAAVAFASARNDKQLHEAIATRQGIGEAIGVLMHRHELSRSRAFETLKESSQTRNIKLRDVAAEVVERGEAPGGRARESDS